MLNLLRLMVPLSTPQRFNMPHCPNPLETTRINHEDLHELTEEQLKETGVIEREEEEEALQNTISSSLDFSQL